MDGMYDVHVHSAPDIIPRKFNDVELALLYREAGFKGMVIKNHYLDTAGRAGIVSYVVDGLDVFGGIALNYSVGGLNPYAVEACMKLGGKVVWMPTVDAANHRAKVGKGGGISVLNGNALKREVLEILEVVRDLGGVIATGHLSFVEIEVLLKCASEMGVERKVVTHPEFWITRLSIPQQNRLLEFGVYIERCLYSSLLRDSRRVPIEWIVRQIRETGGASYTIVASDLGQVENGSPVEVIERAVDFFSESGFSDCEIKTMFVSNPSFILN